MLSMLMRMGRSQGWLLMIRNDDIRIICHSEFIEAELAHEGSEIPSPPQSNSRWVGVYHTVKGPAVEIEGLVNFPTLKLVVEDGLQRN
jgi:hypothetical protein